jgi:hypothetical protein
MAEYLVTLCWSWGRLHRFSEKHEFYVDDRNEIFERSQHFIKSISRRYAYDCGRLDYPLNLCVQSIKVTPVKEEYLKPAELAKFDAYVEQENEKTKNHIINNTLFVNGHYNLD